MLFNVPRLNEPENNGNGHEEEDGRISPFTLIFFMFAAGSTWFHVPQIDAIANNTRIIIGIAAIAVFWSSFSAWLWLYAVPWLVEVAQQYRVAMADDEPEEDAPPPGPAVTPPPRVNLPNGEERRIEQTAIIWTDNSRITVDGKTVDLTDYQVSRDQWDMLAKARRRGQFPTISPTTLHDVLGIDRKERAALQDSDAHRVIGLLLDLELIQDGGERRPYVWTDLGDSALPPPRSQLSQGQNQSSLVEATTASGRLATTGRLERVG